MYNLYKEKSRRLLSLFLLFLFLFVGVLSLSYILRNKTSQNSLAQISHIETLNSQIRKELKTIQNSKNQNTISSQNNLGVLLQERKEVLNKLAEENPSLFLQSMFTQDEIKLIPNIYIDKGLVEKERELKGGLSVIVYEDFKTEPNYQYTISTNKNGGDQKYSLYFVTNKTQLLTGDQIIVNGYVLDSIIVTNTISDENITSSPQKDLTNKKLLVIPFKFTDDQTIPFTKEELQEILFDSEDSLKNYYYENSDYNLLITGDVTNTYTINMDDSECENRHLTYGLEAQKLALQDGYDSNNYNLIIYVFPHIEECVSIAWGYIGGKESFINGYVDDFVFSHEVGHNLGLQHAGSISCGEKAIDDYQNCTFVEYGDPYDVMGTAYGLLNTNVSNKAYLKWIPETQSIAVTETEEYSIIPLLSEQEGIKTLKIKKQDTNQNYYIEYRQREGFDNEINPQITNGATIRIREYSGKTRLVNPNPHNPPSDTPDVALEDGETFTDLINGIYIRQISHTPDEVKLWIEFTKPQYTSYSINLKKGLNLISLPLEPINSEITEVLKPIAGYYDQVLTYSNELAPEIPIIGKLVGGSQSSWLKYDPKAGLKENTLSQMSIEKSYYITMNETTYLTIIGRKKRYTAFHLEKGFNMLGYPLTKKLPTEEALDSIKDYYSIVWSYDPYQENPNLVYYNDGDPTNDTLQFMEPGKGYKIFMKESANVNFFDPEVQ